MKTLPGKIMHPAPTRHKCCIPACNKEILHSTPTPARGVATHVRGTRGTLTLRKAYVYHERVKLLNLHVGKQERSPKSCLGHERNGHHEI